MRFAPYRYLLPLVSAWLAYAASHADATQTVAAGLNHSLAIKSDGTLWTWGYNYFGALGIGGVPEQWFPGQVSALTNVVAAAGGTYHSLAVEADGSVWAWGYNAHGQLGNGSTVDSHTPVQVSNLSGVITVEAGAYHSVALKSDGTVWAWGFNGAGQLGNGSTQDSYTPVQVVQTGGGPLTGIIAIAAGQFFTLAVKSDGTVWAWGDNSLCQYGNGGYGNSSVAIIAGGGINGVVAITAGESHAVVLKTDGTVWGWGLNNNGQLGDGTINLGCHPVQASNVGNAIVVTAGQYHTLALLSDGTMKAWGYNNHGQLGNGNNLDQHTPVPVSDLTGVTSVAAGTHSIALKSDGTIWSFGTNTNGQLGTGTSVNSNLPTQVVNLVLGPQVATPTFSPEGGYYLQPQSVTVSCATTGATIHYTTNGNDPTESDPPITSGSNIGVTDITFLRAKAFNTGYAPSSTKSGIYHIGGKIAGGYTHSLAIQPDGVLWSWGDNSDGQLGTGDRVDRWLPTSVSDLSNVVAAAGGFFFSLAVEADGSVWAWGDNTYGQLGDGTHLTQRLTPVQVSQVSGFTNIVAVAAGWYHSVALKSDGTVWAWGYNGSGQLGNGSTVDSYVPVQVSGLNGVIAIAAGQSFTLALKSDGTVWGFGNDYVGQLGDYSWTNSLSPIRVGTIYDVVAIATGVWHTVALRADGTVWGWGNENYGQLGDGGTGAHWSAVPASGVANVVAIAAGPYDSLAVKMDGTVMAWGQNNYGQLGDGSISDHESFPVVTLFTNGLSVAAGNHTLVLTRDGSIWGAGLNANGQLGNGTTLNTSIPTAVANFNMIDQVAAPTFSPDGGLYPQGVDVVVSCATYGAVIHYTTNGSFPTQADPIVPSGSSVHIASTTELRAKAFNNGSEPSLVKSALYEITTDPNNQSPPVITLIRPAGAIIVP